VVIDNASLKLVSGSYALQLRSDPLPSGEFGQKPLENGCDCGQTDVIGPPEQDLGFFCYRGARTEEASAVSEIENYVLRSLLRHSDEAMGRWDDTCWRWHLSVMLIC